MDTTLRLAFSMHESPGIYALLLGSGISQSVGVKTGWEITQDLIQRLQLVPGADVPDDIRYDQLLEHLATTEAERNRILRRYFEPDEVERKQGMKLPSRAHKAIAKLVQDGFIKVILTTNFDRLMELALEDLHITPDVIRSDDMLNGATPIRHSEVTIVQLHGDYRDVRTLNTPKESAYYSPEKNAFLDQVLGEYGLIVCGWSARWDGALRDALYRITQRWYSTYWVEPNDLSPEAQDVIHHRSADVIRASGDVFFSDLQGNVEVLARLNLQHPLTVIAAVEKLKKLIPRDDTWVDLEDLLLDEGNRAYVNFSALHIRPYPTGTEPIVPFYQSCISDAFSVSEVALNLAIALCWYGKERFAEPLASLMYIWGSPATQDDERIELRKICPLLLLYGCGMAALRRSNWRYLHALFFEPKLRTFRPRDSVTVLETVWKGEIFARQGNMVLLSDYDPISRLLKHALRPAFSNYFRFEADFDKAFDLFEMLLAVVSWRRYQRWISHDAALTGYAEFNQYEHIVSFWDQGATQGREWGLLEACFDNNHRECQTALREYREGANKPPNWGSSQKMPDYADVFRRSFPGGFGVA